VVAVARLYPYLLSYTENIALHWLTGNTVY
jgi:hypothetical protein